MTNWDDCVYVQLSVLTVVWRLPGQLSIRDILLDVYSHSSLKDILKGAPKVFCEEVVAVAPLMIQNLKGGGGGFDREHVYRGEGRFWIKQPSVTVVETMII